MKLSLLTARDYELKYSKAHRQVFNTAAFAALNVSKTDEILYFDLKGSECSLGIIFGKNGNNLLSPFSAPFGGFVALGKAGLANIHNALTLIRDYAAHNSLNILISLPPAVYSPLSELTAFAAPAAGFCSSHDDINYHIDLAHHSIASLTRAGRKNLAKAEISGCSYHIANADNDSEMALAYKIIEANRNEHGYPLRMSLADLLAMRRLIDIDLPLVKVDGEFAAAAVIYRHSPSIAQVIYWGDLKNYRPARPMNRLAYAVARHYGDMGIEVLDIGPASTDGIPNDGLCTFKESIGCVASLKHSIYFHNDDLE